MPIHGDTRWTDADFDELSWHDNHVHGLTVREGKHGTGDLILDVDFILEWVRSEHGIEFIIAPADLVFHDVSNLRIAIDYAALSAAMGPFSLQGIQRRFEARERYTAQIWTLDVNFPSGQIELEATGFTQLIRRTPIRCSEQVLSEQERQ